jgi:hypothetical protein
LPHNRPLEAASSLKYRLSHSSSVDSLFYRHFEETGYPHSLLAEYVVALSLESLLTPHRYSIDIAPQSIEHGNGQRGVDLLILNPYRHIMMGIDVKLRANNCLNHNGGSWLPHLESPFINLTLGNWPIASKDPQVKSIKDWITKCVIPNIPNSGKIPQLNSLRLFLVPRLINSLDSQLQCTYSLDPPRRITLPETRQQMIIYRQKIKGLISLFTQIYEQTTS